MRRILLAAALLAPALPAAAQVTIRTPRAGVIALPSSGDPKRPMLGISTSAGGRRDTLGLLVTSVTANGPAERAGLEEGNRLVSINGVNLKLSRDDAEDDYMQGVNQNRLMRELRKVKAGDEVSLEVWGGGRMRAVKVKTVAAEELMPRATATVRSRSEDRAALGLFVTATGSKRDTAGIFVQQVVEGGPAEKAGIVEGDRIASINGVDVRVPREDTGEWQVGSSRVDRLEREIAKQHPGDVADLLVVSGGRSRSVKVTLARASEVPGGFSYSFRTGPGGIGMFGPGGTTLSVPRGAMRISPRIRIERRMQDHDADRLFGEMLHSLEGIGPQIHAEVFDELHRELPRAMDELHRELPRALEELRFKLPHALDELRFNFPHARPQFDDAIGDDLPGLLDESKKTLKEKIAPPPKATVKTVHRVVL